MSRILRTCILGLFCLILALSFNTAYGKDYYQFEASTEYLNREMDSFEMRDFGLLATTYFKKVNLSQHPMAEAAFIERIGSLSVPAGFTELDFSGVEGDGPVYGAKLTYSQPGRPLYAKASFQTLDADFDEGDAELSHDEFSLGIGMFLRDGWLISFEYGQEELELSGWSKVENDIYTASTKWVNELGNGRAVNIEANLGFDQYDDGSEDGSNTILGAAGDYYFNTKISLGAGLSFNTGDDEDNEGNTLRIRSGIFFNPHFSIRAAFEKFVASNDDSEDEQVFNVSLLTRF